VDFIDNFSKRNEYEVLRSPIVRINRSNRPKFVSQGMRFATYVKYSFHKEGQIQPIVQMLVPLLHTQILASRNTRYHKKKSFV